MRVKRLKRASQQACPSYYSYYDNKCSNSNISFVPGCYFDDPCADNEGGASQQACPSYYSYYDNKCSNSNISFVPGCFFDDPCADDEGAYLSTVPKLGARELTINIIPVSATSSAASTSTQTTTKTTSPAPTETPTAASPNNLRSTSNVPTSSSPISSTTSTTVAQIATPVAAVSSPAPAPPSQASQSSPHSRTVAVAAGAVAAGAVGAIVGVIIALILIVLVLRWIKRRKEDKVPTNLPGNDVRLPKGNSNGAGSTQDGSGKSIHFRQVAPLQKFIPTGQRGASPWYLHDYVIISRP